MSFPNQHTSSILFYPLRIRSRFQTFGFQAFWNFLYSWPPKMIVAECPPTLRWKWRSTLLDLLWAWKCPLHKMSTSLRLVNMSALVCAFSVCFSTHRSLLPIPIFLPPLSMTISNPDSLLGSVRSWHWEPPDGWTPKSSFLVRLTFGFRWLQTPLFRFNFFLRDVLLKPLELWYGY